MQAIVAEGQTPRGEVPLPRRASAALGGSQLITKVRVFTFAEREREFCSEALRGNVPDFWRRFVPVEIDEIIADRPHHLVVSVAPDYFALGSDTDYFLAPLSPDSAQMIADAIGCMLPTTKIVDAIYRAARVKLEPIRIAPSAEMISVGVFAEHNRAIREQRAALLPTHPLGALVAGHKKDVVLTSRLASASGKVAIYGWHDGTGRAIQPLYVGHRATWVDYSHGIRFIQRAALLDGKQTSLATILADPTLAALITDEQPAPAARYATAGSNRFTEIHFDPEVRVSIDLPPGNANGAEQRVTRLIVYALPNGNTIEQTWGRRLHEGDDWHFDLQHIAAQTRWLRAHSDNEQTAVACIECAEHSWPAWRKKHGDTRIREIVEELQQRFLPSHVVLAGHSGGGSFIFGFINACEKIPPAIERIAFLDADYAFDPEQAHGEKLADWLAAGAAHVLAVFAYRDDQVRLNGKPIVSPDGGTWGRTQAMLCELRARFPFIATRAADFQVHTSLDGRVALLLHENPRGEILHTRLVERNGFIHALLIATPFNEKDYRFFGERVYADGIPIE
jgi:hypothetical protein